MKTPILLPPIVALILAGVWNLMQLQAISSVESECETLRERITVDTESSGSGIVTIRHASNPEIKLADKPGWRSLLSAIARERRIASVGQTRAMIAFQRRLAKMSPQEMVDVLNEIAGYGLPDDARGRLEHMIIELLIQQDPELALTYYADHLHGNFFGWGPVLIPNAFSNFVETDLPAATAWFDQQIANGKFDLRSLEYGNEGLRMFEGILLNQMLKADPGLAANRLTSHPEEQRAQVLQGVWQVAQDAECSKAYANLVRSLVPADQQDDCFAHLGLDLRADMDYSRMIEFLDSVQATPAERTATAVAAAAAKLKHFPESGHWVIDEMKQAFNTQAPEQTDRLIGKALADSTQLHWGLPFENAVKHARQYYQESGNDEVLVAFLRNLSTRQDRYNSSNITDMIQLAEQIKDGEQRTQVLNGLKSNRSHP
jgi:hypothetical protein